MSVILAVEGLAKSFTLHEFGKQISVLKDVSFMVKDGEFVGISGRSGSGKSTIFRCLYRTYLPQEGEIWYRSHAFGWIDLAQADVRQIIYLRKHEISLVSQLLQAPPRTTAIEIVRTAALEKGWSSALAQAEAEKILSHFDLEQELWDRYTGSFSGGEKLRLNIARAMVTRPKLLLLDEPTASLDAVAKQKVRELIQQLIHTGTTMLGIFHDVDFMEALCHREYRIEGGRLTAGTEAVYAG